MSRPVTLFTGQWADLPLEQLAPLVSQMGYDGLELACWGDHFDPSRAGSKRWCKEKWELLADHQLDCFAISNHLVGQAVCDRIDERHQAILPEHVWGDGEPEAVRRRAAKEMIATAKACRRFMDARPTSLGPSPLPPVVNGFTGSSIWHLLYSFPPVTAQMIEQGFADFARRWTPILNAFDQAGVNFALEVHPTEIAFDIASAQRARQAVKNHRRFGFNYDPSHLAYQGVDYVRFIHTFAEHIFHVHIKDVWWGQGDGSVGVFGGHTEFGDPRRYWDFRSPGRGNVHFEAVIAALNDIRYPGPLSVEWEDIRMDRLHGAREACAFTRRLDFPRSDLAFDAAFDKAKQ